MNCTKWEQLLWKAGWWFAPPRCPICQNVVLPFTVCEDCQVAEKRLRKREPSSANMPQPIDAGFCRWNYKDEIRHAIVQMKFSAMPYQAENLILLLCCDGRAYTFIKQFDIIVPIPSTEQKRKSRGYDVPLLLAKSLHKTTKIPLAPQGTLIKIKETPDQVGLTAQQRRDNLKNAFCVQNSTELKDKKVLLVDDVMTTGTTLKEAAKEMKKAGAIFVGALVLAQTE